jgi:hypothetical protein
MRLQKLAPVAVLAVGMLGFVRVASAQDDTLKGRAPGGSISVTETASAKVKAIDAEKRTITLQKENGEEVTLKCGKEVQRFDEIKVGDTVKAAAIAQLIVSVGKDPTPNDEAGTVIARTPMGAKPGIVIARTEDVSTKITAVDPATQTVTIQGADGQPQKVQVASDVDLSGVKPGQDVIVQVTKGIALWVEKPGDAAQPAAAIEKPEAFALEGGQRTATVESIDKEKRLVTLKTPDGFTRTIHLGKEAINFDQIQVGDKVTATLADEIAVSVTKGGGPPSDVVSRVFTRAPEGQKPRLVICDSETVTGKIKSIDADKNMITISEADGGDRTVKAGSDVKLSELKAGDDITARVTQALAIVVEKP